MRPGRRALAWTVISAGVAIALLAPAVGFLAMHAQPGPATFVASAVGALATAVTVLWIAIRFQRIGDQKREAAPDAAVESTRRKKQRKQHVDNRTHQTRRHTLTRGQTGDPAMADRPAAGTQQWHPDQAPPQGASPYTAPAPHNGPQGGELPATGNASTEPALESAKRVVLPALTVSGTSGLTVDRGSTDRFDVYGATLVGRSHARAGHSREDAYALGASHSGSVYIAVADGVGSTRNSHAAAVIAVQEAVRQLHHFVPKLDWAARGADWPDVAAAIARNIAQRLTPPAVDDLAHRIGYAAPYGADEQKTAAPACTIAFAALGPVTAQGYRLLWGCIGDCDVLVVDMEHESIGWRTRNPTKMPGGPVSNITEPLPGHVNALRAGAEMLSERSMAVLATDGMADALRAETSQFAKLLPQVARSRPSEDVFGQIVNFDLPQLHDDRTLVAAWPSLSQTALRPV